MSAESSTKSVAVAEEKISWADEDPEEETAFSSGEVAVTSKLKKIESLSISDDKKDDVFQLLEEPDESDIEALTSGDVYSSAANFEDLNLSMELIMGLKAEMGFIRPSKIQAITLPMILTPPYKNLVAQARNGSGKTTCFVLGMLSRVDPRRKVPQAICVCPTRELAQQNHGVLLKMGKYTGITAMCAIPLDPANYVPLIKCAPVIDQVVIGTPGTIKKWMSSKKLSTQDIKILVFDEADHMLAEDGFRDDSEKIMKDIKKNSGDYQVLLFSATFSDIVNDFVTKVKKDGNEILVKKEKLTLENVKQFKVHCPSELAKIDVIKSKIFEFGEKVGQTIIFVRTRDSAGKLHKSLIKEGYGCTAIQGALGQVEREKIIKEFKDGYTKVLITTDILARGFDQSQVNLIINYDLPIKFNDPKNPDHEVYLHRIGRAGRFGRKGAVFNLMCNDRDLMIMKKIEDYYQHHISEVPKWNSDADFETALKESGLV